MISSISQAPIAQLSSPARLIIDSPEVIAERLAKAQANGGTYEDPALGTATTVELSPYWKATQSFRQGEVQVVQAENAGRSMETIKKELGKIDVLIAKRRPELAGSNWDFKLVDGKFKVTGLDKDDAKWLEAKLNANTALRNAADSFISAATANLETTDANPARQDYNEFTGKMENFTFYKVSEQLTEKLSFRVLLTQADQIVDSKRVNMPPHTRGSTGIAVAATMLTATDPQIEGRGAFFTTSYGG